MKTFLQRSAARHLLRDESRAIQRQQSLLVGLAALVLSIGLGPTQEAKGTATDEAAELDKKFLNPVTVLIRVPFQNNFEFGGGPNDVGFRYQSNVQPVIPISLNRNWNLISRTILPIISQHDMVGNNSQSGPGNTTQSFFFSPKQSTGGGWIRGAGPAILIPTTTDDLLGTEKFGFGPIAVLLKQEHRWTCGTLVNHIWSMAGDGNRQDVSASFLQAFFADTTHKRTSFTLNTESFCCWKSEQWMVPINLVAAQLVKIGRTPVQFQFGAKYYANGPMSSPDWGIRFCRFFALSEMVPTFCLNQ